MNALIYTIFDKETRLPLGHVTCAREQLDGNVREGCLAIEGRFEADHTRLGDDDRPVTDHGRAENDAQMRARAHKLAQIEELERRQARRVRELLAQGDERLREIDQEIARIRSQLV